LLGTAKAIGVTDDVVCVAAGSGGLALLAGSGGGSPVTIGEITANDANDCIIEDGVAYVADGSAGLSLVDVSDLTRPETLSVTGLAHETDEAIAIALTEHTILVATQESHLTVFDRRDLSAPARLSEISLSGIALDVVARGDFAFVANHTGRIDIVDLRSPEEPIVVGSAGPVHAHGLAVEGLLLFAAGAAGLSIVDITTPSAPRIRGRTSLGEPANGVAVFGSTACVVADSALYVIDARDPASPRVLDAMPLPDRGLGVAIADSYAYVAAKSAGLLLVDLCDRSVARAAGSVITSGSAVAIHVDGTHVALAMGRRGVAFHAMDCGPLPAVIAEFRAEIVDRTVSLSWSVAGSENDPVFNIERRKGAEPFERVNAASIRGAGLYSFHDPGVDEHTRYTYRLIELLCGGEREAGSTEITTPGFGPYPHALSLAAEPRAGAPGATFRFALPGPGPFDLALFDVSGRRVWRLAERSLGAGEHSVSWSGTTAGGWRAPPGIYVLRLGWGTAERTERVVITY
jgi:hypothetical protein